jgi:hypothetical protein
MAAAINNLFKEYFTLKQVEKDSAEIGDFETLVSTQKRIEEINQALEV